MTAATRTPVAGNPVSGTALTAQPAGPEPDPRPQPNRRSRKKSRTHKALVEAAAALFESRGFDETTTLDVAEAADVSQRTLFRHFPTKEALLYGDMDEAISTLRDALDAQPVDVPVLAMIDEAITALADDLERNRERRLLQARLAASYPSVSAYFRSTVQMSWEREIIVAVARRLGVDPLEDPRPEIVAGASMSAIRVATRQWTVSGGSDDYLALIREAVGSIRSIGALAD